MELIRHGDNRYTLNSDNSNGHFNFFVLQIRQPFGDAETPRFANKVNLVGQYKNQHEAHNDALLIAEQFEKGEIRANHERIKKTIRDYELIGSASFRTNIHKWQPMLQIISKKEKNRGAKQDFSAPDSALARNLFDSPSSASKNAIDYGERVVLGFIGGLHI
jgi:hypothetical protein